MAKKKELNGTEAFSIISLRRLCLAARYSYTKLYKNLIGSTTNMAQVDKTILASTAAEEMKPFFKFLGFKIKLERID